MFPQTAQQIKKKKSPAQIQAEALEIRRQRDAAANPDNPGLFLEYPNDPAAWIEAHFYIPETSDHRTILMDYHKACLREALHRDAAGNFPYSLILWCDIKKSIKSMIAAAVALWMAYNTPWGSIKIVANDLKQADSREMYYIRRAIMLHPKMRETIHIKSSGYLIELPNQAKIEAIPVDPKGEAGGNDDAVFYTELWAANNKAAEQLWTETTLSPTKYGKSFRWVETYAGFTGKSPLLEQLWESGVKYGLRMPMSKQFAPALDVFNRPDARMFSLWNKHPRCPWQTPEYYAQEMAVLTPSEFNRVHRNEWSTPSDAFCPIEWWENCKGNVIPVDKNAPHIMAMDAAVDGDTFGLLLLSGGNNDHYYVRYSNAWRPKLGEHILYAPIEEEVNRLLDEYNVVEICYDPYQLEDMSQRLRAGLRAHLFQFGQGAPRLIADKSLRDTIRDRRVHHNGDPLLSEHVTNADAKSDGDKLRIVKRSPMLKIDLCVCLSMAMARAVYWKI